MPTAEDRKERAVRLLFCGDSGDAVTAAGLISDDFRFQFMERADSWSVDGKVVSARLDRAAFLQHGIGATKDMTRDGMHFTVDLVLCDGDYVCIFGESHALSNRGETYNNSYCWRMRFSGELISEFREYCDTHHAHMVLFA
ncbi:MAG: hypothetical protein EOP18_00790 [Rhizobiaceae bacterium]|nr:MAG: hypothetical protein EOP18_00790 [Rhizobiaceae bacterium]